MTGSSISPGNIVMATMLHHEKINKAADIACPLFSQFGLYGVHIFNDAAKDSRRFIETPISLLLIH